MRIWRFICYSFGYYARNLSPRMMRFRRRFNMKWNYGIKPLPELLRNQWHNSGAK